MREICGDGEVKRSIIASFVLAIVSFLPACGLIFGAPMRAAEFERARQACALGASEFTEGSYLKGSYSIIDAPSGASPSQWEGKLECVAKLFGGDGVSKPATVSFVIRFNT